MLKNQLGRLLQVSIDVWVSEHWDRVTVWCLWQKALKVGRAPKVNLSLCCF